jgi:hypothetical protein
MGLVLSFAVSASVANGKTRAGATPTIARMKMESTAFKPGSPIARKYTCQGQNVSPPLEWSGEPAGTRSLALMVEDPDAPAKTWVHWLIFNLPPGMGVLPENMSKEPSLMNGTRQGSNDFGETGWDGPCPPSGGPHRYYFHLYALDEVLGLGAKWNKDQLVKAMKGHILAEASLMGTYQKKD